eukprot:5460835-Alexandrium_andersonii.AAC.1
MTSKLVPEALEGRVLPALIPNLATARAVLGVPNGFRRVSEVVPKGFRGGSVGRFRGVPRGLRGGSVGGS